MKMNSGIIILLNIVFTEKVIGGQFLHLTYPSGSRPNNTQAQAICTAEGNYALAIVDTQTEYDRMVEHLNQTYNGTIALPAEFWIGAFAYFVDGNWTRRWTVCDKWMSVGFAIWSSGEPNGLGTQNCHRITQGLQYRTTYCDYGFDVMCEAIDGSMGVDSCTKDSSNSECQLFASCWWTPPRLGLIAGFVSLITFFLCICIAWKCLCANKNKINYEEDIDDDQDADENKTGKPHDIMKNYNMDNAPVQPAARAGINSAILRNQDNSWMTPEELSFSARYAYKE